jgi:hypothetical protein
MDNGSPEHTVPDLGGSDQPETDRPKKIALSSSALRNGAALLSELVDAHIEGRALVPLDSTATQVATSKSTFTHIRLRLKYNPPNQYPLKLRFSIYNILVWVLFCFSYALSFVFVLSLTQSITIILPLSH